MDYGTVALEDLDKFILGGLLTLPRGAKLKHPRHTVADLLAIPLKESTHYVHLVEEPVFCKELDWDSRLPHAFKKYLEHVEKHQYALRPRPALFAAIDKLRFKLRKKLIQWKVIV